MGVYLRRDSPFYWMLCERPGLPPIKASTKILKDAPDVMSRKLQRQQAEEVYRAHMTQLARSRYQLPNEVSILFNAFADWYDEHHTAKHKGHERERAALAHLRAHFGTRDLTEITHAAVQEYETKRTNAGIKPRTVNREVSILKAMLIAAVPTYLAASPLAGRKQLRTLPLKKRVLSPEEETRLLEELPARDRPLFIVALDTLIRLSNAVNLSRTEDKGTHLELYDSKTGPYDVPLSRRARRALDAIPIDPKDPEHYFPHRRTGKHIRDTRGTIRRLLTRACRRAGIPYGRAVAGVTWHTATRATGATRMLRAGVDPKTVQEIGNWKSLEQMGEYLVTDLERKRKAVNTIGARNAHVIRKRKNA